MKEEIQNVLDNVEESEVEYDSSKNTLILGVSLDITLNTITEEIIVSFIST